MLQCSHSDSVWTRWQGMESRCVSRAQRKGMWGVQHETWSYRCRHRGLWQLTHFSPDFSKMTKKEVGHCYCCWSCQFFFLPIVNNHLIKDGRETSNRRIKTWRAQGWWCNNATGGFLHPFHPLWLCRVVGKCSMVLQVKFHGNTVKSFIYVLAVASSRGNGLILKPKLLPIQLCKM